MTTHRWVKDQGAGARAVSVVCLVCGRKVKLSEALIDANGPSFRAYYCATCVPEGAGDEAEAAP